MNDMATRRKPAIRGHKCIKEDVFLSQSKAINQVHEWLAGNHDPENGMIYKMIDTVKSIGDINIKLTGISGIVTELHEESMRKKVFIKTEKEKTAEKRAEWLKWAQTIGIVIAACGLIFTAVMSFRNNKNTISIKEDTKVTNEVLIPPGQSLRGFKSIIINNDTTSTYK